MREDNYPTRGRLNLDTTWFEKEGCGAGTSKQLAPGEKGFRGMFFALQLLCNCFSHFLHNLYLYDAQHSKVELVNKNLSFSTSFNLSLIASTSFNSSAVTTT